MVPRKKVFDPYQVGVYHCFSQCVRQLFLLGYDVLTRLQNGHRRDMAVQELKRLAGLMGIEVLDFALMENHVHTVLRNRPDIVASWPDREVARRWWYLCPGRTREDGSAEEPTEEELDAWVAQPERIAEMRLRLSHISWFMWFWLGKIAKTANREDGKRGHFFAGRFKCKRLEDEGALLACSIYTVLNPVRAGMVAAADDYSHSSLSARVAGELRRSQRALGIEVEGDDPDAWLAPLFLDERSDADVGSRQEVDGEMRLVPPSNPFPAARLSEKGYLPMTLSSYVGLMRWTAEHLRATGTVTIPQDLERILSDLGLAPDLWLDTVARFEQLFHYIVGSYEKMTAAAARLGQQWLQGVRHCEQRFGKRSVPEAGEGTSATGLPQSDGT